MNETLDSNLGVAESCPCAGSKSAVAAQLVAYSHRSGDARCNHVADNISPNTQRIRKPATSTCSSDARLQSYAERTHRFEDASLQSAQRHMHTPHHSIQAYHKAIQIELARCSKRYPRLAGASSMAYPAWGEEVSKKPPGLRQAMPPTSSASSRG